MNKYFVKKWNSEFGWELFAWQGHLRRLSKSCEEIIVCCEKGHELLYKDFSSKITYNNQDIEGYEIIRNMENDKLFQVYRPALYNCVNIKKMKFKKIFNTKKSDYFDQQDFIKFGKYKKDIGYDIVLHGRKRKHRNSCNLEKEIKKQIEQFIYENKQLKVCSIGSIKESVVFENTIDLRGIDLECLSDILRNSRVIVGPSSGPMHFASLCECYQIVWSERYDNIDRYTIDWNPFGTGVSFIWKHPHREWQKEIINEIKRVILYENCV